MLTSFTDTSENLPRKQGEYEMEVGNVNEMGWACGSYGGGERCAQGFGGEA
jgi:hypothetical protein